MQRIISRIYQGLAQIFLAGMLVQFFLVGAPLFGTGLSFQPHRMLGDALGALTILLLVLALAGRLGRKLVGLSGLLVALVIIQVVLPSLRGSIPWIAALHPVNALALMGVGIRILRTSRDEAPQASDAGAREEVSAVNL